VEELCRALGISCVVTGYVRHEVVLALLSVLDVLVMPRVRVSSTDMLSPLSFLKLGRLVYLWLLRSARLNFLVFLVLTLPFGQLQFK